MVAHSRQPLRHHAEPLAHVQRQGRGELQLPNNGGRYAGAFKDDVRCGNGEMTFPDGSVYKGQWEHDRVRSAARVSSYMRDRRLTRVPCDRTVPRARYADYAKRRRLRW